MKYIGAGIFSIASIDDDVDVDLGTTIGWIRTDFLVKESDKHGLGLFLGVHEEEDVTLELEASYTYFFHGLSQPGFNIGLAVGPSFSEDETGFSGDFQVGYQF
jgi:hypothetical protein